VGMKNNGKETTFASMFFDTQPLQVCFVKTQLEMFMDHKQTFLFFNPNH
jgi:hypothetical protein